MTAMRRETKPREAGRRADRHGHRVLPGGVPQGHGRQRIRAQSAAAAKALGVLLNGAAWLGKGSGQQPRVAELEIAVAMPEPSAPTSQQKRASG